MSGHNTNPTREHELPPQHIFNEIQVEINYSSNSITNNGGANPKLPPSFTQRQSHSNILHFSFIKSRQKGKKILYVIIIIIFEKGNTIPLTSLQKN